LKEDDDEDDDDKSCPRVCNSSTPVEVNVPIITPWRRMGYWRYSFTLS